jgi:hypothetical protein
MPWLLYPNGKSPWYPLDRMLADSHYVLYLFSRVIGVSDVYPVETKNIMGQSMSENVGGDCFSELYKKFE